MANSQYKPAKHLVAPPSAFAKGGSLDPKEIMLKSVGVNPTAKFAFKGGERFPTHRVLRHGGQTNNII